MFKTDPTTIRRVIFSNVYKQINATHCLYLPSACYQLVCLEYSLTLKMEAVCSSETVNSTRLHGATSQKIALFIVTDMRTSNPTKCLLISDRYPNEI
jgi:hypothetical protein